MTDKVENQTCKTPWEDLRRWALEEYEKASVAAHSWASVIPRAINYYFDHCEFPPDPQQNTDSGDAAQVLPSEQAGEGELRWTAFPVSYARYRIQSGGNHFYVDGEQFANWICKLLNTRASQPQATGEAERTLFGELWLDATGDAHFICHTKDDDFPKTKAAFEKFITLLQRQITNEKECPFFAPVELGEDEVSKEEKKNLS